MFLVFNKEKIVSYVVAVCTVIVLFLMASVFTSEEKTIATSSNSNKLLPIYNVNTEENKIAITINCAWNADDIDLILKTLEDNQVKVTFFVVGDWVEKYRRCNGKNI